MIQNIVPTTKIYTVDDNEQRPNDTHKIFFLRTERHHSMEGAGHNIIAHRSSHNWTDPPLPQFRSIIVVVLLKAFVDHHGSLQ